MKTVRWGIIGCGDVTEVKSGPGFQKGRHSELVAVMRRNGALAADYARRHGVPRWYDDAEALIGDPEVDAVYVATPPNVHWAYTLMAARAGKPVYVEKPMARTHEGCQQMIGACRGAGVPLWVAYYRRSLPKFLKIKELVDSGSIGEVRAVTMKVTQPVKPEQTDPHIPAWRVVPAIAGGGLFLDLASHMLDFLDYLLGPIRHAEGFARNQGGHYAAEDIVSGAFEFASGVLGIGTWHFTNFSTVDRTELEGTGGRIRYACFDPGPIVVTTPQGTVEIPVTQPEHVQQPLIQTIVDELNGQGTCPSTGESAARTAWVMDQLLAGYREQHGRGF